MKIILAVFIYFQLISIKFCFIQKTECLWSTYRPGPYFGIRSSIKDSPLFGLLWYAPKRMDSVKTLRHFMEPSDNISEYDWKIHNGCDYGKLNIEDSEMNLRLEIIFKNTYNEPNGNHWIVRVNGTETNSDNRGIVLMFYISNPTKIDGKNKQYGVFYQNSTVVGNYQVNNISVPFQLTSKQNQMNKYPSFNETLYNTEYYIVLDVSDDKLHDPTESIIGELKDIVGYLPNHLIDPSDSYRSNSICKGNVFVKQLFLIENFGLDIHFFDNYIEEDKMDSDYVSNIFNQSLNEFQKKFNEVFLNKTKRFHFLEDDLNGFDDIVIATAQSAMSTLFSNIIYMNGNLQILDLNDKSVKLSRPLELLTIGPDKTSHSRGFMWDEGFQEKILSLWNMNMSLRIVNNWFQNIDDSGWLPREQSLDNESRSRAAPSSWAAIPDVANPPSLYLFIEDLFSRKIDHQVLLSFCELIISNLEKNANWFINSQKTQNDYLFAWKGKTDDFCLPSGLDDYPRCRLNGKSYIEGHIDLQSWIIILSRTMVKIYKFIGSNPERQLFWTNFYIRVRKTLINEFWNDAKNKFDDFYINENGNKIFSEHQGYLQLFPIILNVFDNSIETSNFTDYYKYIDQSLKLIIDPNEGLRTNFGIRSLSLYDPGYMKGQNYWTSPIWININYLIIRALNKLKNDPYYSSLEKDYQEIRKSVVNNMVDNFINNGYIWEVYNDMDGHGMYNHPFTGWSALIVNLIFEDY